MSRLESYYIILCYVSTLATPGDALAEALLQFLELCLEALGCFLPGRGGESSGLFRVYSGFSSSRLYRVSGFEAQGSEVCTKGVGT